MSMDRASFEAELKRDGFLEVETKSVGPNVGLEEHTHPYDVRAMVLEGEVTLRFDGKVQTCRPGDSLTMAAGCAHSESYGPQGVTYIVGRRKK
jgi:mannose-6-phosphate isomerase-like protein (cupin superfamily)